MEEPPHVPGSADMEVAVNCENQVFLENWDPDLLAQLMNQPIYVVPSQSEEVSPPQEQQLAYEGEIQIVDDFIDLEEFIVQKKASPKGGKKKHKRVVVNKKKTSRKARRSSSSLTDDSMNSSSSSPQSVKSNKKGASANIRSEQGLKNTTVCRFQCKVCGQTRFLVLRGRLPQRQCECGSSAVFIPCWIRTGSSCSGGGLGRECVHCPRCSRFYSSKSHLSRHKCVKQLRGQQTEPIGLTGVFEMPCCPHCNECFIFDSQLASHTRREHRAEKQ